MQAFYWQQQLASLREAIASLSSGVERLQRPADAYLQQFQQTTGSWRLCLRLLEAPYVQLSELFWATNNLRAACLKHQDVLEVVTLNELLPQLAYHLQSCLHRQQWAPANQLASAIAALASRSPSLQADSLPQAICNSFSPAVAQALADASTATEKAAAAAAAAAATAARQPMSTMQQAPSQWGYSGWHSNLGTTSDPAAAAARASEAAAASSKSQELLQMKLLQEPLVLSSLLQVLAVLPETLQSKQVLWYTFDRRDAVKAGLLTSNSTTLLVSAALCCQSTRLVMLSCDTLSGLCELGSAPVGLEAQTGALQVLAGAMLTSATASKAADALAALAASCKGCLVLGIKWQLLQEIVVQLQQTVFPALSAQHQGTAAQQSSTGGLSQLAHDAAAAGAVVSFTRLVGSYYGLEAEAAFCRMLCAVASALLTPVLQGAEVPLGTLDVILQQLLLSIGAEDDGIAMTAVNFWQEDFVTQMQALPRDQQAVVLLQQQPVIHDLVLALIGRSELKPTAISTATADARDLPEELRLIRRELAAAMRNVGKLVGHTTMLAYVTQSVQTHHQEVMDILNKTGALSEGGTGPAILTPAAAVACCHLEGGLYSANVVLGRLLDVNTPEVDAMVSQLVAAGAHAATSYTRIHKLAGTALTLMGGLPNWLVRNQAQLPGVLSAASASLRSPDDKLARNAATCVQRLTACEQLAALLFATQTAHVQQFLQEYQRRGGLPVTLQPSDGDDQSTEELLLLGLCSIAVAHSSSSNSVADIRSILAQLVGPQLAEASSELTAALQGKWPQEPAAAVPRPAQMLHTPTWQGAAPWRGGAPQRRGQPAPQLPPAPPSSRAVVCFEAIAKLVAGLPTGVSKYTIGVPMHNKTRRHQKLADEVSALLGPAPAAPLGFPGQPMTPAGFGQYQQQQQPAASARASASANTSSASSEASSPQEGAGSQAPDRTAQVLPLLLHIGQGRQQPRYPLIRQEHASLFVSQLLLQASDAVTLALQVAALAATQPHSRRFGGQLVASVCNFLQLALPAALHHKFLARQRSSAGGGDGAAAGAGQAGVGVGTGVGATAVASGSTAAPEMLEPPALILQLCQLLEQLPVDLLQQTGSLQLLLMAVVCAAVAGALPAEECLDLDKLQGAPAEQAQGRPSGQEQQQLLALLQRLVGPGLTAASQAIVTQAGGADEDLTVAALSLFSVCLQRCPAVLMAVDMGLVSAMAFLASNTYHLKQATAFLDWVQVTAYGAYAEAQPMWAASSSSSVLPAAAASSAQGGAGAAAGRAFLAGVKLRFEAGMGVQLVLALLMAASGGMPSDLVLPVSLCLHALWLTVGPQLFQAWLQAAVLQAAPDTVAWSSVRHVLKLHFTQTLTEHSCISDTTKFKGILKSFCGGRQKGPGRH